MPDAAALQKSSVVLVTGARGGIGQALVHQLLASGHRVAAAGRDLGTMQATMGLHGAHLIACDASTESGAGTLRWQHVDRATASHDWDTGQRGHAHQFRQCFLCALRLGAELA
jgi:NAD(P)-dependent dehydrogenase (short-subunit alcohol dehydrogenase family)